MAASGSTPTVDFRRAAERALLGVIPVLVVLFQFVFVLRHGNASVDYRVAYWPAGHAVLHGQTPYGASPSVVANGNAFVYPAPAAVMFAITAIVPLHTASWCAMVLALALAPATLLVLNVRDWRVYGAMVLSEAVFGAWQIANLSLFLAFALALLWRWRDKPPQAGFAGMLMIAIKLLGWPVLLFLGLTRRWRALASVIIVTGLVNLIAWAIVGFSEISVYVRLTRELDDDLWRQGYGLRAVAASLGVSETIGQVVAVVVPLALAAYAVLLARHARERERELLSVTVAIILTSAPLIWNHYFALLIVPLAIWYPRFHWVWLLPVLSWVLVLPERVGATISQQLLAWGVAAICLAWPIVTASSGRRASRAPTGAVPLDY